MFPPSHVQANVRHAHSHTHKPYILTVETARSNPVHKNCHCKACMQSMNMIQVYKINKKVMCFKNFPQHKHAHALTHIHRNTFMSSWGRASKRCLIMSDRMTGVQSRKVKFLWHFFFLYPNPQGSNIVPLALVSFQNSCMYVCVCVWVRKRHTHTSMFKERGSEWVNYTSSAEGEHCHRCVCMCVHVKTSLCT